MSRAKTSLWSTLDFSVNSGSRGCHVDMIQSLNAAPSLVNQRQEKDQWQSLSITSRWSQLENSHVMLHIDGPQHVSNCQPAMVRRRLVSKISICQLSSTSFSPNGSRYAIWTLKSGMDSIPGGIKYAVAIDKPS